MRMGEKIARCSVKTSTVPLLYCWAKIHRARKKFPWLKTYRLNASHFTTSVTKLSSGVSSRSYRQKRSFITSGRLWQTPQNIEEGSWGCCAVSFPLIGFQFLILCTCVWSKEIFFTAIVVSWRLAWTLWWAPLEVGRHRKSLYRCKHCKVPICIYL